MGGYLIISLEKLESLRVGMSGGGHPIPTTVAEGVPIGAVKALRRVVDIAEREITEEEFDYINQCLHDKIARENNGGFRNPGE